jgi:hypothetical protein
LKPHPVLFVHGHNFGDEPNDPNYENNFFDDEGLSSFKEALDRPENDWLELEPYYIQLVDQDRSIVDDAADVAAAVNRILVRHDPSFDPSQPNATTDVKISIIAYSKGTISTRLYLKSLTQSVPGLPTPLGFNPISEFVAISPPNHGTSFPGLALTSNPSTALSQLNNGYSAHPFCQPLTSDSEIFEFMEQLNGDPTDPAQEAPGSRENGSDPASGTLHVTLYADGERDSVGGSVPSNDCNDRKLARNKAPHAVNIEVSQIPGGNDIDVHQNTVHTAEVICLGLHTAVHRAAPIDLPFPPPSHYEGPRPDFSCNMVQVNGRDVPLIAPKVAVMLVLDLSGSMLFAACPSGCQSKLDVLKRAVHLLVDLWKVLAGPGERVGLAFFGTQVTPFTPAGQDLLPVNDANGTTVIDHVESQTTTITNLTAMGGGLQAALDVLRAPGRGAIPQRHVILFTDGMQNVNPIVKRTPPSGSPYSLSIEDVPPHTSSNVAPSQPPTELDEAIRVAIHTLAVGATGQFLTGLAEIATKTNGRSQYTDAPDQDLVPMFLDALLASLRGNTPQLVDYRRGVLQGSGSEVEGFAVGRNARRIVLKLSWRGDERLGFSVEKDGIDVTSQGRVIDGTFYRIFAIDPPVAARGVPIGAEGEWRMRLSGRKGLVYDAAAIVDEPSLDYQLSVGADLLPAGEPLRLSARLSVAGRRIDGGTVLATVLAPGASLGNLLALENPSGSVDSLPRDSGGAAQRKYQLLLDENLIQDRLKPAIHRVTLAPDGRGRHVGTFEGTQLPGAYRVIFELSGDDPAVGSYRRRETLSFLVTFGKPQLGISRLRTRLRERTDQGRTLELSLRPRDQFGNHLGPGHAEQIAVTLSEGTVATPFDGGDGRYAFLLDVPVVGDPDVEVSVAGERLFEGSLSLIEEEGTSRVWWWIGVGIVVLVLVGVWVRRR